MNKKEFTQRVTDIRNKLIKVAYTYLHNDADANDVLAESMYKALKNLRKLREERYFDTWITRIVINECMNELRRRKRFSDEDIDEKDVAVQEQYDSLELKQAIATLPHDLKIVITLRFFGGYTLKECADILSIPQGTVVTRQRRALALLKLEMEEEDYEQTDGI